MMVLWGEEIFQSNFNPNIYLFSLRLFILSLNRGLSLQRNSMSAKSSFSENISQENLSGFHQKVSITRKLEIFCPIILLD